ncbi:unnamed protein product [Durusdinium trenchii]|uniref:Transmembrane protein n=1 Tax=Durusdinium trenchii TaxID=1381693 RepID=A0ABP0PL97_9DINO
MRTRGLLVVAFLPGVFADATTGTSTSSKVIWARPAVPNGARQDDLTDKLVSDYGLQNEAPNQSEGSGRIAKIIVCVILGSSAVWFCRQNWGQVESALADLRAGFRYSAVSSCDGGLLTVDPEEPARRAPLDEAAGLYPFLIRFKETLQRWVFARGPDDGSEKEDPCTPEEKQGLLGGNFDDEEGQSEVSTNHASPLFNGDEDSMAAIIKLRPSVHDSVGDEEEVDSARPIIGSEREELLSR